MIMKSFNHVSMSFDNMELNGAVAMTTINISVIINH